MQVKMWKLVPNLTRLMYYKPSSTATLLHTRSFLSESFKLDTFWNNRLQSPILNKINVTDLFNELDSQFQQSGFSSSVDVDLFVNAVDDDSNFDEIEDVVHKFRLSPEAINILPSTQHAIIRLYMKFKRTDDLLRILDDRLNYGIFCDDYCALFMMDTFIKAKNFRDAAQIGTFCMLQEDLSNPIINYMSLYAGHQYINNRVPWNKPSNEIIEPEDEDEIVKVRVRYIRNPYFDDHFDLVDPNHLIGKTLAYIGSGINDEVGRTYKLIGLILHNKLDQVEEYIKYLASLKDNNIVVKDGLVLAVEVLDEMLKRENKDDTSSQSLVNKVKELLNNSLPNSKLVQENLLTLVESKLKDLVTKCETSEIEKQKQLYNEWEESRQKLVMEQIANINREKQLAEIQRQKQLLKQREEEIFFFDNEEKLDLIIEEKEKRKEEERERERKRLEAKTAPVAKSRKVIKKKEEPPLDSFFDENIPMKLINTKL